MNKDKILTFVSDNWEMFPKSCFYQTSYKGELVFNNKKCIYLYSLHKIKDVRIESYLTTLFFHVYKVFPKDFKEIAGFIFIPSIPKKYKIRYTPVLISVTGPEVNEAVIAGSESKVLIEGEVLMLWYSCGVEVITNLGEKMGVYIGDT